MYSTIQDLQTPKVQKKASTKQIQTRPLSISELYSHQIELNLSVSLKSVFRGEKVGIQLRQRCPQRPTFYTCTTYITTRVP